MKYHGRHLNISAVRMATTEIPNRNYRLRNERDHVVSVLSVKNAAKARESSLFAVFVGRKFSALFHSDICAGITAAACVCAIPALVVPGCVQFSGNERESGVSHAVVRGR